MIPFNQPPYVGTEQEYIKRAIQNRKISGDGEFTLKCNEWIENTYNCNKALLMTSGTHALEISAILSGIEAGDEVIMPSYTFVSTANAFVLRGAKVKFVDIRPDTMNIDENLIEAAITSKTKAIVPVHYAGVSCEMGIICDIADKYKLTVIEDAAQGVNSYYKSKPLGTIGDYGCYSFHETKNYSMGEGGAIIIKDKLNGIRAEIIREKGTNRNQFFRGEIDKYTWVDKGSSYLPSEINAAYLYAQLLDFEKINNSRLEIWKQYHEGLRKLEENERIRRPFVPEDCVHNGHMYYIRVRNLEERTKLLAYLKDNGVGAVFHYVPLHSSIEGRKCGEFIGEDKYTTKESECLIRLPMYYGLEHKEINYIIEILYSYFKYN